MAEFINMPRLSDTMEEGTLVKWYKKIGDKVSEGDLLAEIETDKAVQEFESEYNGYLLHIGIPEGKSASVNCLLAIIGTKDENVSELLSSALVDSDKKSSTILVDKENDKTSLSQNQNSSKEIEIINMPRLSDTMEEGTLVKWYKKIGDKVSEGDLLAEIETDKAVQEFESEYNGYLLHMGLNEGQRSPVDSILAVIGPQGMDVENILTSIKEKSFTSESQLDALSFGEDLSGSQKTQTVLNETRILASPLAKKIAKEKSILLSQIKGSGKNNRIVKKDLEKYHSDTSKEIQCSSFITNRLPSSIYPTQKSDREVVNSSMRKIIARRLSESKYTAPHYYLMIEVDMKSAIKSRKVINASIKDGKISFNDLVIKAAAIALRDHSQINTSWNEDKIIYHDQINIGVAVAVEDGILVPVILGVDQKGLREISAEVKDKAARSRLRKIQTYEMDGSTFTISNLGMFGIETFTSIINQPNSCILSVGAILEKPIVKNNQIVPGNVMKLSLSCDHRVVDGATASAYLQSLKKILENPVMMIT